MKTGSKLGPALHVAGFTRLTRGIQRKLGVCALTILGVAVFAAQLAQAQTFNAPDAGTSMLEGTIGVSINTAGTIAGTYIGAGNVAHGFVRSATGTITEFTVPDAGGGNKQGTFFLSINTKGAIAGMYSDGSNRYHGFVRVATGTITTFDVPGAFANFDDGTTAMSINTAGDIGGLYRDKELVYHAFVRAASGTITASIDAPGAGTAIYQGTEAIGINTAGDIAGFYIDSSYIHHGFVRAANGGVTTFDVPDAGTGGGTFKNLIGTAPLCINTAGDVAGTYTDATGARHGFERTADGTITTFDAPGAATGTGTFQGTVGISINTAGTIAGTYVDASDLLHGFVRSAKGAITSFDIPGASAGMLIGGTASFGINTAGKVTGAYSDTSMVFHGFLLTPTTTKLTSSPKPSTYGEAVTFAAVVTSKGGTPPDGETVSFMNGATVLGTGTLSGGSASFKTSALSVGTTSVTAVYVGDSSLMDSTSNVVKQVVRKPPK